MAAETLGGSALRRSRPTWLDGMLSAVGRRDPEVILALMALGACAVWTLIVVGGATGVVGRAVPYTSLLGPLGPLVTGLGVMLWRPHSPSWLKLSFGWTLVVLIAVKAVPSVGNDYLYGLAPVGIALLAVAVARRPVETVVIAFFLTGVFGSVEAFTPVSSGQLTDGLFLAAWLGLAWNWLTGRRDHPRWLPVPLVLLTVYLIVTAVFVALGDDTQAPLYSFRSSAWLMMGVLLVALLLTEERQYIKAHHGVLLAGALIGAYAMLRWAIGPAPKEEDIALAEGGYVLDGNGDLRLIGSLPNPTALGVWCSVMVPFAFASALAPIGRGWRLVALAGAVMCGAAIAGADTRAPTVAAGAGLVVVLVLFAAARGVTGRRALPLALGTIVVVTGIGVFTAAKLADQTAGGERFRGLLDPINDESVQGRLNKWQTVLDDIDQYPFGHGLGASGAAEQKYARFSSAATFDPDSTYVKVAYDQGMMVLLLFCAALAALVLGLGQRAIRAPDARAGTLALGACGALTAFCISMAAGVYFESLLGAAAWLIVGLAMAPYIRDVGIVGRPRRT